MLKKQEILSIGSIVRIHFENDEKDTIAVIIGHLSLTKRFKCHYDYICVEHPYGLERGIFYINHTDIIEIIENCKNNNAQHSNWMERKYPEYMAYYNQYNHDERPDKDSLREQFANAEEYLTAKQHKGLKIILNIIIGIMLFAMTVFDWRIGIGADISFIVGVLIGRL